MKLTPEQIESSVAAYRKACEQGSKNGIEALVCGSWATPDLTDVMNIGVPYRVKPTPTPRPWKLDEVPVGEVIQMRADPDQRSIIAQSKPFPDGLKFAAFGDWWTPDGFLAHCLIKGQPCGVVE